MISKEALEDEARLLKKYKQHAWQALITSPPYSSDSATPRASNEEIGALKNFLSLIKIIEKMEEQAKTAPSEHEDVAKERKAGCEPA